MKVAFRICMMMGVTCQESEAQNCISDYFFFKVVVNQKQMKIKCQLKKSFF